MNAYLAVSKNKRWAQIVTADNNRDLFWAIDEFSDPYSFIFKHIKYIPVSLEIPLRSQKDDEEYNYYTVPKTRDVELGGHLLSELQDVFTGIPPAGWKSFVDEGVVQPYVKALGV